MVEVADGANAADGVDRVLFKMFIKPLQLRRVILSQVFGVKNEPE